MNKIYVIEEQPNPSSDYYVLPAIGHSKHNIIKCGFKDLPDQEALNEAIIIFVRYVPNNWATLVDATKDKIKQIIFFIDDDVLDFNATESMPWHYRLKLFRLAATKTSWLKKNNAQLWVSTPYLLQKYGAWSPRLISPSSVPLVQSCRVFYHGSSTHKAEVHWLRPIIEEVLKKDERITFDIVGEKDTFKAFKGLPRVTTIHPMKWPAYLRFTSSYKADIGLAPLLNNSFNKSRSYCKFFDFTRSNAVGIYSKGSEYEKVLTHEKNGLILATLPEIWIDNILDLAKKPGKRKLMLSSAKDTILDINRLSRESYQAIKF